MRVNLGCTLSISMRMVKTKSEAELEAVEVAVGLFCGKKLETKSENKIVRKKLFSNQNESKTELNHRSQRHLTKKKVILTTNSPTKAFIEDKFPRCVSNGKSADEDASPANHSSQHTVKDCPANGRTISPKRSENIYSKVYSRNFSKIRSRINVEFELNNISYKISNVRINLVKVKLSGAQLRSLRGTSLTQNDCLKKRRHTTAVSGKKSGIPVLLIPHGSYTILDSVVPGKVSRIPHSLRYIKPSRTADNYGLGNKQDIEYDDEECPRKAVPRWAQGDMLDEALAEQEEADITSLIFSVCDPPNLDLMFPQAAAKRDIWRTPPSSYSSRWGTKVQEVQGGADEELVRYVTDRLENKNC